MGPEQDDAASRRYRLRVPFETTITLEHGGKSLTYNRTHDVSMNGVYVRTAQPLPVGIRAAFRMILAVGMRHETIVGECEVARSVSLDDGLSEEEPGPGMGLKFVSLEPESSETLFNIIRYNQPPEQA